MKLFLVVSYSPTTLVCFLSLIIAENKERAEKIVPGGGIADGCIKEINTDKLKLAWDLNNTREGVFLLDCDDGVSTQLGGSTNGAD